MIVMAGYALTLYPFALIGLSYLLSILLLLIRLRERPTKGLCLCTGFCLLGCEGDMGA